MPQPIIRRVNESDAELADRFIDQLDDNFLYCRGTRRHRYPVLMRPRNAKPMRLPKGFTFEPVPGEPQLVRVSETCEICGRVRITTTRRDAFLTSRKHYKYEDPEGYTAPRHTGAAMREGNLAARELDRRLAESGLFGMPDDA